MLLFVSVPLVGGEGGREAPVLLVPREAEAMVFWDQELCGSSLAVLKLLVGGKHYHLLVGQFYRVLEVILGYLAWSLFLQLSIIN